MEKMNFSPVAETEHLLAVLQFGVDFRRLADRLHHIRVIHIIALLARARCVAGEKLVVALGQVLVQVRHYLAYRRIALLQLHEAEDVGIDFLERLAHFGALYLMLCIVVRTQVFAS